MTLASKAVADSLGSRAKIYTFSKSSKMTAWQWSIARQVTSTLMMLRAALSSRGHANIYLVPSSSTGGLVTDITRALLLRLAFRRIWLHHHVSSYCNEKNILMTIMLRILSSKTRHVVLDANMAHKLEARYAVQHFFTLNNASLVRAPSVAPQRVGKALTVGFLGNLTQEKGVREALVTMEAISELSDDFRFVIAGPVIDSALLENVDDFLTSDPLRRKHLGAVSGIEKQMFYEEVDILLFPTKYKNEAQPLTIYEGMANSCVVLATPLGGIPEQLSGLNTCFESRDYLERSVEIISEWIEQPERLQNAQMAARRQFERHRKISERQLSQLEDALSSTL
jgi:glycosyltransferase involved in cell wall biosynthesis